MILTAPCLVRDPSLPPLRNAAVVIDRGRIRAVGNIDGIRKRFPRHSSLELPNTVLLPGLINLHTHLELPPLLSDLRSASLPGWVLNLLKAKRHFTSRSYEAAVRENIRACIETGTTTIGEICTHDASPGQLKGSGLRAFVYRELISMDPSVPLRKISELIPRSSGLVRGGISPHAPHTVSEKVLRDLKEYAVRHKMMLSMHVAESIDEIRLLQGRKSGFEELYSRAGWQRAWAPKASSPFAYLHSQGLLDRRFLAVHAVHATDDDIQILKRTKTVVAHCPRSNKETGVGRMKLKRFLDAGITVGLGTDSLASSPSLNMWDEMRYALKVHRRDGVSASDVLSLATIGGAHALGCAEGIGTIEPGKRADIIAVPLPSKATDDICSDLLRDTNCCIMSMVNGKILWDATRT